MKWYGLVGLSLFASGLLLGCQNGPPGYSTVEPNLPNLLDSATVREVQARGQQAEPKAQPSKSNLLDIPPDESHKAPEQSVARIRAAVGGEAILEEEVLVAAAQQLAAAHTDQERADIKNQKLEELIDREVVMQECINRLRGPGARFLAQLKTAARKEFDKQWLAKMMKGNGYTDEDAFERFLAANNMPLKMIRRGWERNFIAMEYLRYRIEPHVTKIGHLHLQEYYDQHPGDFKVPDSVEWQDIFILASKHKDPAEARRHAEVLAERIRKGEEFVRLAKQFDNGLSSTLENAAGTGRERGQIDPHEAEAVLFAMSEGETKVVETGPGFHIVRLVKRQRAGIRPFDDAVQKQIKDKLRNEVFAREMKRIVNELKRQAVIEKAYQLN